jgi:hypothetical protein
MGRKHWWWRASQALAASRSCSFVVLSSLCGPGISRNNKKQNEAQIEFGICSSRIPVFSEVESSKVVGSGVARPEFDILLSCGRRTNYEYRLFPVSKRYWHL